MKYAIVLSYADPVSRYLFSDFERDGSVDIIYLGVPGNSHINNLARSVYTSLKVNEIISLPYRHVFFKDTFEKLKKYDYVILSNVCAAKLGVNALEKIRKNNVKLALILVDSFGAHSESLFRSWKIIRDFRWDRVFSYDKNDCEKFGFTNIGLNYYSKTSGVLPSLRESDIYYIGTKKQNDGRDELIKDIGRLLEKNGTNVNFTVLDKSINFVNDDACAVRFIPKPVPYLQVLSEIASTNCILELLQNGQEMQTLRYFEAVCYNKKLLTNNRNIVNLPFYHPDYMKVFSSVDEIDIDWVRKKENIDYGYNGEFSPLHLKF